MVVEDTGCSPADAAILEDIMRNEVFHSTLDWQTRSEHRRAAREAHLLLNQNRAHYEGHYRNARAAHMRMRQGHETTGHTG